MVTADVSDVKDNTAPDPDERLIPVIVTVSVVDRDPPAKLMSGWFVVE